MPLFDELARCLEEERLVALATVTAGSGLGNKLLIRADGSTLGSLGSPELDLAALEHARELMPASGATSFEVGPEGDGRSEIFLEIFAPPPQLIIVGAVHTAIPLVQIAKVLGFRTVVIDARAAFATPERFPHADELIVRWPAEELAERNLHEGTFLAFLSHDPKLDNPALVVALRSRACYVGALGSKKTHAKRVAALRELGLTDEQIARIHAPIGLKLGGRRPEEIATGIAAQLVQARYGEA